MFDPIAPQGHILRTLNTLDDPLNKLHKVLKKYL